MATRAMARRRTTNDALPRFTKRGPSARGITRGVAAAATTCLLYYYTAPVRTRARPHTRAEVYDTIGRIGCVAPRSHRAPVHRMIMFV